jgi:hypothetical protein
VFHARFLFKDDVIKKRLTPSTEIREWTEEGRRFEDFFPDLWNFNIWVQLPGVSTFLGPVYFRDVVSTFVIKGHCTNFYILPDHYHSPLFVTTERPPRICGQIVDSLENQKNLTFHGRWFQCALPGSVVVCLEEQCKNVQLDICKQKFAFSLNATYFDVQQWIALQQQIDPNTIPLLGSVGPVKPRAYPFVRNFPWNGSLSFQVLSDPATALSISMHTPLRLVYVAPSTVHHLPAPLWVKKGTTCRCIIANLGKYFPDVRIE